MREGYPALKNALAVFDDKEREAYEEHLKWLRIENDHNDNFNIQVGTNVVGKWAGRTYMDSSVLQDYKNHGS